MAIVFLVNNLISSYQFYHHVTSTKTYDLIDLHLDKLFGHLQPRHLDKLFGHLQPRRHRQGIAIIVLFLLYI